MPLVSYALTSVQRQKDFLGISNDVYDTILERLINSVTEFIERYCDRRFKQTTYTNQVYDGTGTDELLLKNYPVTTFTSLEKRDSADNQSSFSTVDSQNYFIKLTEGIIVYVGGIELDWKSNVYWETGGYFVKLPQHYRATYIAGYDFNVATGTYLEDVGLGDLEYAVWKLVAKTFNQRKGTDDIQSESIGEYSVTYRKELMYDEELQQILNNYRRPVFGL